MTKNKYINPENPGSNFTQVSNVILKVYTQHPEFKPSTTVVYIALVNYYNDKYGYAFPSRSVLSKITGLDKKTITTHLNILEKLDLIDIDRPTNRNRFNNMYFFKQPATTTEEFYRKFPDIAEQAKKRIKQIEETEKSDIQRLVDRQKELYEEEKQAAEIAGTKKDNVTVNNEPVDDENDKAFYYAENEETADEEDDADWF